MIHPLVVIAAHVACEITVRIPFRKMYIKSISYYFYLLTFNVF